MSHLKAYYIYYNNKLRRFNTLSELKTFKLNITEAIHMGLDMYLTGGDLEDCDDSYSIGYWRKANAVHGWFVRNVQGGVDDCNAYSVSREQLIQLKDVCLRIKQFGHVAVDLLPTTEGFFFGSTEYDKGYFVNLDLTVTIVDRALAYPEDTRFWYHSSW